MISRSTWFDHLLLIIPRCWVAAGGGNLCNGTIQVFLRWKPRERQKRALKIKTATGEQLERGQQREALYNESQCFATWARIRLTRTHVAPIHMSRQCPSLLHIEECRIIYFLFVVVVVNSPVRVKLSICCHLMHNNYCAYLEYRTAL